MALEIYSWLLFFFPVQKGYTPVQQVAAGRTTVVFGRKDERPLLLPRWNGRDPDSRNPDKKCHGTVRILVPVNALGADHYAEFLWSEEQCDAMHSTGRRHRF
jgi:hypothetical protein